MFIIVVLSKYFKVFSDLTSNILNVLDIIDIKSLGSPQFLRMWKVSETKTFENCCPSVCQAAV